MYVLWQSAETMGATFLHQNFTIATNKGRWMRVSSDMGTRWSQNPKNHCHIFPLAMNYMKSLSACALTNSFFRVYIYATGLKKKKKKPAVYKTWNDANCNHTSQAKQETKLYRQTALPCQCMSNQDRLSPSRGASQVFIICTCNTE